MVEPVRTDITMVRDALRVSVSWYVLIARQILNLKINAANIVATTAIANLRLSPDLKCIAKSVGQRLKGAHLLRLQRGLFVVISAIGLTSGKSKLRVIGKKEAKEAQSIGFSQPDYLEENWIEKNTFIISIWTRQITGLRTSWSYLTAYIIGSTSSWVGAICKNMTVFCLLTFLLLASGSAVEAKNKFFSRACIGSKITTSGALSDNTTVKCFPSATVTAYAYGTASTVSLWSDESGTTPLANPLTANSTTGEFVFYADAGYLDIRISGTGVATPFTVTLGSTQPITSNDTRIPSQGENDALPGTYGTPSSSNKYVTNSDPRVNATVNILATDYGAIGDGVADDTASIQAAVNAISWIRGGVLTVPGGLHYKTTANITFPRVQQFGVYSTVSIYAYGAVFEPTSAVTSVFYYHPSTQTINDNVIYNSIRIFGAQFKVASRTSGQTGINISSCEGCRFQDLDFVNMNGIHLRTAYRTIIENSNVQVDNEFGFKIEAGDWTGATSTNSPSNGTIIRNSRVIPGSGSSANYWLINADLSGIEHCISEGWDSGLYPNSGNPAYEVLIDNSGYALGQTNFIREYYSERPSLPTAAMIGAVLNGGTLTLDLVRRFDDSTGVIYVDATGSTTNSVIKLRDWSRIDAAPTPRFKTATGVQWRMDSVGEAGNPNYQNSAWWSGGTVGAVSQWGLYGIVISGGGSSSTAVPAVQLGQYGLGAETSFGISRGPDFFILGSVTGDSVLVARDRTKRFLFGMGDGTDANDKPVFAIDSGAVGAGATGILILENGTLKRVSVGAADSCSAGFRCLRIPN